MTRTHRTLARAGSLAAAALLAGGCAAVTSSPVDAGVDADGPRLLLRVADPAADGATVARLVRDASGADVATVVASGGRWHAVRLRCAGAACDAALARLRAAAVPGAAIDAVEPDGRRRPA